MPSLSVCCLARNEEKLIGNMIASVKNLANEVIVLDTGSSDKTVATAQSLGARVEHFSWQEDFSAARNAALSHATGDWVLALDADEVLLPASRQAIEEAIGSSAKAHECTILNELPQTVVTPLLPLPSVRMFRRDKDISFAGRVHETIDRSLRMLTWSPARSKIKILHQGLTDGDRMKRVRNRRALEAELKTDPTEAWVRVHVGLNYYYANDMERARENLSLALGSQTSDIPGTARSILLALKADIDRRDDRIQRQARSEAIKATQMGGNVFAEYILAQLDLNEDHIEGAINRFREIDAGSLSQEYYRVHSGELYAELAKAYLKIKQFDKALEFCELAREKPAYDAMFIGGYLCEQKKEYHRALDFYQIAVKLTKSPGDILKRISHCRAALGMH